MLDNYFVYLHTQITNIDFQENFGYRTKLFVTLVFVTTREILIDSLNMTVLQRQGWLQTEILVL